MKFYEESWHMISVPLKQTKKHFKHIKHQTPREVPALLSSPNISIYFPSPFKCFQRSWALLLIRHILLFLGAKEKQESSSSKVGQSQNYENVI